MGNTASAIFDRKGLPILTGIFLLLFIAEARRQLRRRKQPRLQRAIVNGIVSIPAFSLLRILLIPVMLKMAVKSRQQKFGLLHQLNLNPGARSVIAFLLLDYSNYIWHILLHKIPLLWRFHLVHHSDPDLDVSTALRFHFGEIIGSVFFRSGLVYLLGISKKEVVYYEILFESATQFHHSNLKLPYRLEKGLSQLIVTPRMHGIHHSVIKEETDSNYSVILSVWDRLHQTLRLNVPQQQVETGVPSYNDPDELTIGFLLKLPFKNVRPWKGSTSRDESENLLVNRSELAP